MNKHTIVDLYQMRSLSLYAKIRILQYLPHWKKYLLQYMTDDTRNIS